MIGELNWPRLLLQAAVSALFIVTPVIMAVWIGYKKLWWTLSEYRPHAHSEKKGNLEAENIRYPRHMRDKDGSD